jgi:hypothetical protein
MHHGYVDRVAIADSVLMDLLTLQEVTTIITTVVVIITKTMAMSQQHLYLCISVTCSLALSPVSSAGSRWSSWLHGRFGV